MTTSSLPRTLESHLETLLLWQPATWEDYLTYRDDPSIERVKLFFYQDRLLMEMGGEGINHSNFSDLFIMMMFAWFTQHPEQQFNLFGRCQIEKPQKKAGAPDIILYIGDDYPRWQPGEKRSINLEQNRVPNLVAEIADTSIATDLDEKKHLYADLKIPEYWVVDVRGKRVIAFILDDSGIYQETDKSIALPELPINLLEQTIERLDQGTNCNAAAWFAQQIANLKK